MSEDKESDKVKDDTVSILALIASESQKPPHQREADSDFSEWVYDVTREWMRDFVGGHHNESFK